MFNFRTRLHPCFLPLTTAKSTLAVLAFCGAAAHAQTADAPDVALAQGRALVYASNTVTPATREGLQLLESQAEAGNTAAMIELGALYLYGTILPQDWPRALEYFEAAAEAGDPDGIYQYAMMLMWSERAPARAEAMLQRAGNLGATKAWVTLAEGAMYGYLGGGSVSRAKFAGYAAQAHAAGEERIAVLEATRFMWGISVRASGPQTIAVLEQAADAGNSEAAMFLIRLVRSGNRYNIRREPDRASAYLEQYRDLLSQAQIWQLQIAIAAQTARSATQMADIVARLDAQPQLITQGFGADLLTANENVAIYVLQTRLAAQGHAVGQLDGFAGNRTLRAMNAACREIAPLAACADSVMRPDLVALLIEKL
ncbi:hypothetical protein SAMN04488005_1945 [Yoonia tamlensis]|uniref:TPR repeat n=1 Tax=Yoonia tamlensis TaxID=390270 RepID=A0A1I6GNF4_9RHOB|nr:sel1 repeat family protein [Yoonia tamlensis]SFR43730.1 hypothetical protein SAMN04488005_1945 [Yoonia tamlensis]